MVENVRSVKVAMELISRFQLEGGGKLRRRRHGETGAASKSKTRVAFPRRGMPNIRGVTEENQFYTDVR